MTEDPVVQEVRRWREEYAAQFGFDLASMFDDLRRGTDDARKGGRVVVDHPPRRVEPLKPAEREPAERKAG